MMIVLLNITCYLTFYKDIIDILYLKKINFREKN